ncbi:MAG: diadenylate cyclase CdaA [Oscillospiraceae bacterium]|nr:diadenylate cyclase CdaA [Oscillospiraceae bacterium]
MGEIAFAIGEFWRSVNSVIAVARIPDLLDILVVAYLLYHTIRLVRETRAMQLVKGIAVILLIWLVAASLNMITLTVIMENIVQWGILATVILFQPELRRALEQMGRSKFSNFGRFGSEGKEQLLAAVRVMIEAVCQSAEVLSKDKTGALMVIERETKLGDIIPSGTIIDSAPSSSLICNIFYPNTPMHDGAMILREGRLHAAGCFLPLSVNDQIGRELGTRHRAALGISEVSDAIAIVVSEETGQISVAINGELKRGCSRMALASLLEVSLIPKPEEQRRPFWRRSP